MIWPTRRQWRSWTLPSKLTAVGVVIGLISLVVGVLAVLQGGGKRSAEIVGEPATESGSDSEVVPYSLEQYLRRWYGAGVTDLQRQELTKQFKGRRVIWEGYVFDVSPVRTFSEDIGVSLLRSPDDTELGLAFCEADRRYRPDFLAIRKGQRVRVSGVVEEKGDPGPLAVDCRLLKVWDTPWPG